MNCCNQPYIANLISGRIGGFGGGEPVIVQEYSFSLMAYWALFNPAGGMTYYFGENGAGGLYTSEVDIFNLPFNSKLIGAVLQSSPTVTLGTSEPITLALRRNSVEDIAITNALAWDELNKVDQVDGLDTDIAVADDLTLKAIMPAWGTPPTQMLFRVDLKLRIL